MYLVFTWLFNVYIFFSARVGVLRLHRHLGHIEFLYRWWRRKWLHWLFVLRNIHTHIYAQSLMFCFYPCKSGLNIQTRKIYAAENESGWLPAEDQETSQDTPSRGLPGSQERLSLTSCSLETISMTVFDKFDDKYLRKKGAWYECNPWRVTPADLIIAAYVETFYVRCHYLYFMFIFLTLFYLSEVLLVNH